MKQFKVLDLFSGAGGFSSGLDSLDNFTTVEAVDFNSAALETFQHNFPDSKTINGDISDEEIKAKILAIAEEQQVNMIIGGPPCQGFSSKGKKLGLDDPRNFLFREYMDVVAKVRPEVFVIENVRNLLTAVNGFFLEQIKEMVADLGYELSYGVLTASDFGVPQKRQRAILIASRIGKISLPSPNVVEAVTVEDAISDLDYLESGEGEHISSYRFEPKSSYQRMLRKGSKFLLNHKATNHKQVALDKLAMIPPEGDKSALPVELHGNQKFKTTWGRLKWKDVSPTIDTRFDTPSNGTNSHPVLNRAITPREAARIQSFPDTFEFLGKKTEITKQIGNAVPPLMARAIGEAINEQID